jgi:Zn-finger nucleic acid-binding protein
MAADRGDGIEIDVCPSCEATFLDLSSFDARGLDTGVLFGMGPEAAVNRGSSDLACPRCNELMLVFDVPTIAGPLEVERAPCCGGLFLDGGEREPFVRAARRAIQDAADRTFAEQGEVVGEAAMTKSLAESGALTQMMLASIRARVDGMMLRMIEQAKRRHHHHHYHH